MNRQGADGTIGPAASKRAFATSIACLAGVAACRANGLAAPAAPVAAKEVPDAAPDAGPGAGPGQTLAELTDVVSIGATLRGHVACALRGDGSVWCWAAPPCTKGDAPPPTVASRVAFDAKASAVQIATGPEFSCARLLTGAVWCWGDAGLRDTQPGASTHVAPYEVMIPGPATDLTVGQRGPIGAFAQLGDGSVIAWTTGTIDHPFSTDPRARVRGEWNGVCEQDEHGAVRCRGTSEGAGSQGRGALSDPQWRAVPGLANARDLGADDFCGWGIVEGNVVRQDCVYGDCCVPYFACPELVTSRRDYTSGHDRFHRVTLEYRFPFVRRLVTADVGLDDDGVCRHFDGQQIVITSEGPYADMAGGPDAYEGLRADHRVRRFCGAFPEGDGMPVLAPSEGR